MISMKVGMCRRNREYEKETYPMEKEKLEKIDEINILRTEMFLDAERVLKQNSDQTFYYLEAPTGSGKSNTAMNLGFRLIRENEKLNKIFYIYPFNTLVEQNMESIGKIFGENERVMSQVAVVNSLVPMKDRDEGNDWNRILLDRQFLNYPDWFCQPMSCFSEQCLDMRRRMYLDFTS